MKAETETLEDVPFLAREGDPPTKKLRFLRPIVKFTASLSATTTHATVFLLTSVLWAAILAFCLKEKQTPTTPYDLGLTESIFSEKVFTSCGKSPEDAEQRGCVYDILAGAFLPKICLDQHAIDEYKQEGTSWLGYLDSNWTDLLPSTQEMGRRTFYYTNKRDHIVHCALLWKRQYRAFAENWRFIDSVIASEEHTSHCVQYLMDATDELDHPDWREVPIKVWVSYAACYDVATPRMVTTK